MIFNCLMKYPQTHLKIEWIVLVKDIKKANTVHGFQHVVAFTSNKTVMYSVATNGVKSNPSTIGDTQISMEIIRPRKFVAQGKTIKTQSSTVSATLQQVDTSRKMRKHCNNVEYHLIWCFSIVFLSPLFKSMIIAEL